MRQARIRFLCRAAFAVAVALTAWPAMALVIVPTYTANVTPQMQTALSYVINEYESHFSDPVTIGVSIDASGGALAVVNTHIFANNYNYGLLRSAFIADAMTPTDASVVSTLGAADPTGGVGFSIPIAEAQALGLPASGSAGSIQFGPTLPYTFDPNNRAVAGSYDFIGLAEYSIGLIFGGATQSPFYPLGLLRYKAPGVRDVRSSSSSGAYFSIDGGVTNLHLFSGFTNGWDASQGFDAFQAGGPGANGHKYPLSQVDLVELDSIGWDLVPEPSTWTLASFGAVSFISLFWRTMKPSYQIEVTPCAREYGLKSDSW